MINYPDVSYIEIDHHINALGMTDRIDYNWIGKSPLTTISWRSLVRGDYSSYVDKNGVRFCVIGQYRLRVIDQSDFGDWQCIRTDYPFWFLHVWKKEIKKITDLIYHRMIITAAVWGLADFSGGVIPSYKDLHIVQQIGGKKR